MGFTLCKELVALPIYINLYLFTILINMIIHLRMTRKLLIHRKSNWKSSKMQSRCCRGGALNLWPLNTTVVSGVKNSKSPITIILLLQEVFFHSSRILRNAPLECQKFEKTHFNLKNPTNVERIFLKIGTLTLHFRNILTRVKSVIAQLFFNT